MKLAAGEMLGDGRYRLQSVLGRGGMASVWLAQDQRLERPVAIKVIADRLGADPQWRQRFEREARAAASVSHPHIVQVFDYKVEGDQPYLVMEYVSGGSLADTLATTDAPSRALDAETLAAALLDALAHIHEVGIVHRDIKPGNILLGSDGRARLTDFGIAQAQDATQLTQTGLVLGTLKYLAPEVLDGQPATIASDLYAAGIVLREAGEADPHPAVGHLIAALTAAAPHQRPDSARAALRLLGAPVTAATRTFGSSAGPEHHGRGMTRRPLFVGLVSAFVVLVIVVVVAASSGGSSGSRPAPTLPRPGASLTQQLNALGRIVNQAARR